MKASRFFLILSLCLAAFPVWAQVKVVDGDSLEMGERRIRINGIDAPEYNQPCWDKDNVQYDCGAEATAFMKSLVAKGEVRCEFVHRDIYKRELSVCYVGDLEINREMVRQGWAVSYDFGGPGYPEEEKEAKAAKRGIWQGRFMKPELWRRLMKD